MTFKENDFVTDLKLDVVCSLNFFIEKYNLQKDEFCIVGSIILSLHGLRENRDIDVLLSPTTRKRILKNKLDIEILESGTIKFLESNIESSVDRYERIGITDETFFKNQNLFFYLENFRVTKLYIEYQYKICRLSNKDLIDIFLIEKYRRRYIENSSIKLKNCVTGLKHILKYTFNRIKIFSYVISEFIQNSKNRLWLFFNNIFPTDYHQNFVVIIWAPAVPSLKKIEKMLSFYSHLNSSRTLIIRDDKFHSFVHELYTIDYTPQWKIEKKYSTLKQDIEQKVVVYDIKVNRPKYRITGDKKISNTIALIKKIIRNDSFNLVDCYINDNIIHTTDNRESYADTLGIINRYENY